MKNLRIVFMGTPEFAVATLGSLLMNGFNIVAVVTAPDKPAGRGRKMIRSPVKKFAESNYLLVYQPDNLKNTDFINQLKKLNPDIFIVVAFRMLPEEVWKIPPLGTVNLHASLLPQYRGAAPINHAIINGETMTGATTSLINDKIDTGKILLREEVQIFPFETAGDLHDRLMKHGARLVITTIVAIAENKVNPLPQSQFMLPGEILKPAPKIHSQNCIINWNDDPHKIHNLIRGLAPSPCARSFLIRSSSKLSFKIFESVAEEAVHILKPGQIVTDRKNYIKVSCKGGFLNILTLQLEGKKKLSTVEFLRGFKITDYSIPVS